MVWWLGSLGCIYFDVVRGNGNIQTEQRDLSGFDILENQAQVDVTVEVEDGVAPTATVTCDSNLLHLIETEATGDTLAVKVPFATSIRPTATCTALIRTSDLQGLEGSGSGRTEATGALAALSHLASSGSGGVVADGELTSLERVDASGSGGAEAHGIAALTELSVDVSGSGGALLSGTAPSVVLDSSGSGGIDARDLSVVDAVITASGSGEVWLTATGDVTVYLSGSGNVHLYGDPQVDAETSGSGDVILEE